MERSFLKSNWFPFLTGLLGIIIGGFINGFFTITTQNRVFEMNKNLFIGQKALNDKELFIKQLFEYENVINKYFSLINPSNKITDEDLLKFQLDAMNNGQKLLFVSNTEVGVNTSILNMGMYINLANKNSKWLDSTLLISEFNDTYNIWLTSILAFINKKEAESFPGKNLDLVIKEIERNREIIEYGKDSIIKRIQEKFKNSY